MFLVDIKRISLRKEAIPNRIYIDENGNKYIGTKDKRIEPYPNTNSLELQIEEVTNDLNTLTNDVELINTEIESLNDDIETLTTTTDSLSVEIDTKQDTLVSGTNIKTINGNSLLGSGNIVISGGGGGSGNSYFPSGW